jgi:energy-coupling factor transporter ATP-binding protein EcfA2
MGNLKPLKPPSGQPSDPNARPGAENRARIAAPTAETPWLPPPLAKIEDTGLTRSQLEGLVLKLMFFRTEMIGRDIAETIKLPFAGIVETVLESLRRDKCLDVMASAGYTESQYRYVITGKGNERAQEQLERGTYAGPCPVPLASYVASIKEQNKARRKIREEDMLRVLENLIVDKAMLDKIGPAANSGTSIFLYGPPGNGKTTLSEAIGRVILGDDMWIPYAVDVDGQVIQIYDPVNHQLSEDQTPIKYGTGAYADQRWVRIKRPIIIVGGELTMDGLDLTYDPVNKFYEAPYQVKANGGMFLIDDFGRQQVSPKQLLNRWIVPLEKRYDYLTLANGRKIEIPFNVMIIFSTNMDPRELVDDAFLRRIKYKIEVGNPTPEQFRSLFELMCRLRNVPFNEQGYAYLIREWYQKHNRDLRFVHPRDLISQMRDIADYLGIAPTMGNKELIDRAAASYFVEL